MPKHRDTLSYSTEICYILIKKSDFFLLVTSVYGVHVCIGVCMDLSVCMQLCRGLRLMLGIILHCSSTLFIEARSLDKNSEPMDIANLAILFSQSEIISKHLYSPGLSLGMGEFKAL